MRLRHVVLVVMGLTGLVVAFVATSVTQSGDVRAGVTFDAAEGRVVGVSPTGFAWRDGIRPGQVVIDVTTADDPEGWHIQTMGPNGPIVSAEAPYRAALQGLLPLALLSLVSSAFGILFLRANRAWILPAVALAFVAASVPLAVADHELAWPSLAIAAIIPAGAAVWAARRQPALASALATGTALLLAGLQANRLAGVPAGEELEQVRRLVAVGGTGLLIVDRAMLATRRPSLDALTWSAVARWVGLPAIAVGALAVVYLATPGPVAMAIGVAAFLSVPPVWSFLRPRLEAALMADLRELAAADAAEEERARIARELHDVTLQGLSAAIRRLELVPQTRAEADSLRSIADELRAVTIELRPPMLDDLGLGPTLDYLAEQASGSTVDVRTEMVDETGIDHGSRPPASVELAMYRIAQEALTNALRHANARSVRITARILQRSIEMEIADDGVGVQPEDQRRAIRQGRLGLASMRRRARAIGADIAIDGGSGGTRVTVTWQA